MVKNTLFFLFVVIITSTNILAQTINSSHIIESTGQPNEFLIKTAITGLENVDIARVKYDIDDSHTYKPSPNNSFFTDRKNNQLKFYVMAVPASGVINVEFILTINNGQTLTIPATIQYSRNEVKEKVTLAPLTININGSVKTLASTIPEVEEEEEIIEETKVAEETTTPIEIETEEQKKQEEKEQIAKEKAQAETLAAKQREEEEKLAKEKAEAETKIKEEQETIAKAEKEAVAKREQEEKLTKEKAKVEALAAKQREDKERLTKEKTEAEAKIIKEVEEAPKDDTSIPAEKEETEAIVTEVPKEIEEEKPTPVIEESPKEEPTIPTETTHKEPEEKLEPIPNPTNTSSKKQYGVQILALSDYSEMRVRQFCKQHGLDYNLISKENAGGLTKIRYGRSTSSTEIQTLKDELIKKGIKNIFIVTLP